MQSIAIPEATLKCYSVFGSFTGIRQSCIICKSCMDPRASALHIIHDWLVTLLVVLNLKVCSGPMDHAISSVLLLQKCYYGILAKERNI